MKEKKHAENNYSMDIRSSKAYKNMLTSLQDEINRLPKGIEGKFFESFGSEMDYEEAFFGVPFFSNARAQNILKICRPKNLKELAKSLDLIDHPQLSDYIMCCLNTLKGQDPWDLDSIPLCPEDMRDVLCSYNGGKSDEDIEKAIDSIFRMDAVHNDSFTGRDILDNRFPDLPLDYVLIAERIYKCAGYRRFQTRKELAARTKDLVSLALAKEYEPNVYLKAYMKYYAGEKAGNIKTREDFDLFEAQITATGTANMSDYYDYLLLKKLHAYIDWKYDYSSDIVYKEPPLWEIKYI